MPNETPTPTPAPVVTPEVPVTPPPPAAAPSSGTAAAVPSPTATPPAALKAIDPKEAAKQRQQQGPLPTLQRKKDSKLTAFITSINYIGMGKERSMFIQNMATLLNAGLPIIEAIHTIIEETRVKPMKKILGKIVEDIESGTPLWMAMDDQHFFTTYAIALVRIGEESGNLARNMEYLAEQQDKDAELKGKIKTAMVYPCVIIGLVFCVVIVLGMFVLPNLVQVLFALNAPLPLATKILIAFTDFMTAHGTFVVLFSIVGLIILIVLNALFAPVKRVLQWLTFHTPGIGPLAMNATVARFGVILGGLLKAGVPLVESMKSLAEVTTVLAYQDLYVRLMDEIKMGQSFQKSFVEVRSAKRLLPISVTSLIVVGERSGTLADILMKISVIYDKKASEAAAKLPVVLEPILLLGIGGLVGFIAFAILMPIYSVVGNISK
jgi:type IV pilus assembly protein PilC